MNKIKQEILKDIDSLPSEMQEKALDFVRFLKAKQPSREFTTKDSEPNGTNQRSRWYFHQVKIPRKKGRNNSQEILARSPSR